MYAFQNLDRHVCVCVCVLYLGVNLGTFFYEKTGIEKANAYANISARADLLAHLSISLSPFLHYNVCSLVYSRLFMSLSTRMEYELLFYVSLSSLSRDLSTKFRLRQVVTLFIS